MHDASKCPCRERDHLCEKCYTQGLRRLLLAKGFSAELSRLDAKLRSLEKTKYSYIRFPTAHK